MLTLRTVYYCLHEMSLCNLANGGQQQSRVSDTALLLPEARLSPIASLTAPCPHLLNVLDGLMAEVGGI